MNNIELLRDLEVKVQTRKKQLSQIEMASELFEAILNGDHIEEKLTELLEKYVKKDLA